MKPNLRSSSKLNTAASAAQIQALFVEGINFHNRGQLAQAKLLYQQLLQLEPKHFDAMHLLGVIEYQSGQFAQAVEYIGKAIQITPNHAAAYCNLGAALDALKQYEASIECYEKAIALQPDHAEAHSNRGAALNDLKRYRAALESFDRAIAIRPDYAEAYSSRGNSLAALKNYKGALESFSRAIALKPTYAEAYLNCGDALNAIQQFEAALVYLNQAIAIRPDYAEAYGNRANSLTGLRQLASAVADLDKAISLKPKLDFLLGLRLFTKMKICDWTDHDVQLAELSDMIDRGEVKSLGFTVVALSSSLSLQNRAAQMVTYPANAELGDIPKRREGGKIRIGYFSADFHNHATSHLIAELFERHNKDKFELIAFSFGPDLQDEMRQRIRTAFDQFHDVRTQTDKEIALLCRGLAVDIAIDLKGFTQDARTGIFACRAAPIQVSYLGYPGTMGVDYMDYLVADKTLIPEESQQYYTERIVYLPNSYQVNDSRRQIAHTKFVREELGLPKMGFVFCCFNNNFKISPSTFDSWMRILHRASGSALWLLEDNPTAVANLRKEARHRGIDPERLVFAKRMPLPEHLARHRVADLFLDTLPYNAHTTASDALWAGLPVLTLAGESFASRVAASLLTAVDLPELIVSSQRDYEELAVALAADPERLSLFRNRLERNRLTTPLFDTPRFTRHLEAALSQMMHLYYRDLPPDHIYIAQ